MDKKRFYLYSDYKKHLNLLSLEQKGQLLDAIFSYANGETVELTGVVEMAFSFISAQMDRDNENYEAVCQKRRESGSKGGLAKASKSKQILANASKPSKTKDIDIDIDKDIDMDIERDKREINNYQLIADMYNNTCVSFPRLTKLSEKRKKAIKARLNSYSLEDIQKVFTMAEQSDFLKGGNNRNWFATFDWLMNDNNMAKVLDGNYSNKTNSKIEIDSNFRNFLAGDQVVDWETKDGTVS